MTRTSPPAQSPFRPPRQHDAGNAGIVLKTLKRLKQGTHHRQCQAIDGFRTVEVDDAGPLPFLDDDLHLRFGSQFQSRLLRCQLSAHLGGLGTITQR